MLPMTRRTLLFALLMFSAGAFAHSATAEEPSAWRNEIALLAPLVVSGLWYAIGFLRLRTRVSSIHSPLWRNGALFGLGWITLISSLLSPLHELGEISFTAHMSEHELLMLVAAPLMALSRPVSVVLWACPNLVRRWRINGCNSPYVNRAWKLITDPALATALHICALWLWHMPSL